MHFLLTPRGVKEQCAIAGARVFEWNPVDPSVFSNSVRPTSVLLSSARGACDMCACKLGAAHCPALPSRKWIDNYHAASCIALVLMELPKYHACGSGIVSFAHKRYCKCVHRCLSLIQVATVNKKSLSLGGREVKFPLKRRELSCIHM